MNTPTHLQDGASTPFETQPWDAHARVDAHAYVAERVRYASHGTEVVGNLLLPAGGGRHPAVVVIGPVASVKEQAPMQYASRLAREGYAALAFDPRHHGESGGLPRRRESRQAKVEDLIASVDYLLGRAEVDAARIHLLGICQGVNWAIEAAVLDPRVRALGLIAGHYLTPETARLYLGSSEQVQRRLLRAEQAREHFQRTGEASYIPIVSAEDPDALLGAQVIREFYERWSCRGAFWNFHGLWENRITAMSESDIWGHQVEPWIGRLELPTLMIHADRAASGPAIPRELFARIPAKSKQLLWLGTRNQMQFYEDPLTLDVATQSLVGFLRAAGPTHP